MAWEVELSPEVARWLGALSRKEAARAQAYIDRLAEMGDRLPGPHSKSLGGQLRELRFGLGRRQMRITYCLAPNQVVALLTVFAKQKRREQHQIQRARKAMQNYLSQLDNQKEGQR